MHTTRLKSHCHLGNQEIGGGGVHFNGDAPPSSRGAGVRAKTSYCFRHMSVGRRRGPARVRGGDQAGTPWREPQAQPDAAREPPTAGPNPPSALCLSDRGATCGHTAAAGTPQHSWGLAPLVVALLTPHSLSTSMSRPLLPSSHDPQVPQVALDYIPQVRQALALPLQCLVKHAPVALVRLLQRRRRPLLLALRCE